MAPDRFRASWLAASVKLMWDSIMSLLSPNQNDQTRVFFRSCVSIPLVGAGLKTHKKMGTETRFLK